MKKILAVLALLYCTLHSFGQAKTNVPLTKDDYLLKSKKQKKVARILLVGAAGLLGLAGVAAMAGSILFFKASAKNKKRAAAASAYFKTERMLRPSLTGMTTHPYPSVAISVKW